MKKILIILFLFFFGLISVAQADNLKKANQYIKAKMYSDAVPFLRAARKSNPTDPETQFQVGEAYLKMDNLYMAEKCLESLEGLEAEDHAKILRQDIYEYKREKAEEERAKRAKKAAEEQARRAKLAPKYETIKFGPYSDKDSKGKNGYIRPFKVGEQYKVHDYAEITIKATINGKPIQHKGHEVWILNCNECNPKWFYTKNGYFNHTIGNYPDGNDYLISIEPGYGTVVEIYVKQKVQK